MYLFHSSNPPLVIPNSEARDQINLYNLSKANGDLSKTEEDVEDERIDLLKKNLEKEEEEIPQKFTTLASYNYMVSGLVS